MTKLYEKSDIIKIRIQNDLFNYKELIYTVRYINNLYYELLVAFKHRKAEEISFKLIKCILLYCKKYSLY